MNKKTLFLSTLVIFATVFALAMYIFTSDKNAKNNAFISENSQALHRDNAPMKGNKSAKVTIVEFFDPACGTCSQFYPIVNDIVKKYDGKVKVEMRYAPLHKGSDEVVKMLEAAHLQGKFWPALELLFANQRRWINNHVSQPDSALAGIMTLALDKAQFNSDLTSMKVKQAVDKDLADMKTLNVKATPEFFVNGKPMPSFGVDQLISLIDEAIAESY